jgi:hypothetical protein
MPPFLICSITIFKQQQVLYIPPFSIAISNKNFQREAFFPSIHPQKILKQKQSLWDVLLLQNQIMLSFEKQQQDNVSEMEKKSKYPNDYKPMKHFQYLKGRGRLFE